uniref:Uncharacterized protein n=1 Tax=Globodera rostochiensis TaxID=31243 RepID=A0A914I405_GLORO
MKIGPNLLNVHDIGDVELIVLSEQRPPIGSDQCDLLAQTPIVMNMNGSGLDKTDFRLTVQGSKPNGGVAGVCVVQELNDLLESEEVAGTSHHRIIFISGAEGFVKRVANQKPVGQVTMSFDNSTGPGRCCFVAIRPKILLDIAFELFSHVTSFFGYKIVLLGDFAGDRLTKPFENNYRITEGHEYVKVLTKDHHVHGAVLIGETDLEEAIENLILNQTDISQIEQQLLDPDIDLEDFFD